MRGLPIKPTYGGPCDACGAPMYGEVTHLKGAGGYTYARVCSDACPLLPAYHARIDAAAASAYRPAAAFWWAPPSREAP